MDKLSKNIEKRNLVIAFILVGAYTFFSYSSYTNSETMLTFLSLFFFLVLSIMSLVIIRFWTKHLNKQTNTILEASDLVFVLGIAFFLMMLYLHLAKLMRYDSGLTYSDTGGYYYWSPVPVADYFLTTIAMYFSVMFGIRTCIQRFKTKRYNLLLLHALNHRYLSFYIKVLLMGSLVALFVTNLILISYVPWVVVIIALSSSILILVSLQFNYFFYLTTDDQADFTQLTLPPYIEQVRHSREQNDLRVQEIVEDKMKSEKLKTDLITNVSHDIKTPLTSIINYVDLLKQLPIEDERFKDYVGVLDQKGLRLKSLIDDLIEASKIGSGSVEMDITDIDFVELVNQAYSEVDERFQDKTLNYLVDVKSNTTLVHADGRYLYRVLENILVNVVKYSMEGTRVYGTFYETSDRIGFELKNISAQALNVDPQTLMEQFVRGDLSRSQEGHGLGLFIASSLIQLMHGELKLDINGDLFIVSILLPKVD